MKLHSIQFEDIHIGTERQRKNLSAESLLELAGSISQVGLLHPIVVYKDDEERIVLAAGERRLRAMEYVWNFGQEVQCGEHKFPSGIVPCLYLGEIDQVKAYEIELEENARRLNLSWQEHAQAIARLAKLKADLDGEEPSPAALAEQIGLYVSPTGGGGKNATDIRQDIILAKHLDDPEIAEAPSRPEAFKLLIRKEQIAKNAAIGRTVEKTLAGEHRLLRGNCLEILPTLAEASFDVICTDPPYGMDAGSFGDSGGAGGATGAHFYEDSEKYFHENAGRWIAAIKRVAKSQCHVYWFCDIDWFNWLKDEWLDEHWKVFRTPIIWYNPGGSRVPWSNPPCGPQRKSQYILFANKGNRPVTAILGDVIAAGSDPNLNHPAQKPVALYTDLLRRSVRPGDSVLDPFCGSGPIFPAAHGLKCRATGVEQDDNACGIAMNRLKELK